MGAAAVCMQSQFYFIIESSSWLTSTKSSKSVDVKSKMNNLIKVFTGLSCFGF